jgi:hypothetical protein
MQGLYKIWRSINTIQHISRIKYKNYIIIPIDAERPSTNFNILSSFLKQLRIEKTFLNIIKALYDKPISNITLNGEKMKPFPLKSIMRQSVHSPHSYLI